MQTGLWASRRQGLSSMKATSMARFVDEGSAYGFWSFVSEFSESDGECQDLIMWEQMTDHVRASHVDSNFDDFRVPFNEANFNESLKKAWLL
ncbi:unnamed protein product [Phytophthora lilii]|uniref:Unnamed protein product n=1 Tax=Phytophthora lilii TaxID=2077276 RepID=A0A9W7CNK9_9STRA|nr:unnamed protein product [Phytophthora lilii]